MAESWDNVIKEFCTNTELEQGTGAAFERMVFGHCRKDTDELFQPYPGEIPYRITLKAAWRRIRGKIHTYQMGWDPTCENGDENSPYGLRLFREVQKHMPTTDLKRLLRCWCTLGTLVDDCGADAAFALNVDSIIPQGQGYPGGESVCFIDLTCYRKKIVPDVLPVYPTVFWRQERRRVAYKIARTLLARLPKNLIYA